MDDDTVVDHCHKTGDCRAVVCRWCNVILGKLENWAGRIGQGIDPMVFLANVGKYLEAAPLKSKGIKYPTFRTDDEKRLLKNKRARVARAKAKRATEDA